MTRNRRIIVILGCAAIVVAAWIVMSAWAGISRLEPFRIVYHPDTNVEETVDERFDVPGQPDVDIVNCCGDVVVVGNAHDDVRAMVRSSLWGEDESDARSRVDVHLSQDDEGNVRVYAERIEIPYIFGERRTSDVSIEVHVPRETRLYVQARDEIAASGVSGTLMLESVFQGRIAVNDVFGLMTLRSCWGGSVTVEDAGGMISIGPGSLHYGIGSEETTLDYDEPGRWSSSRPFDVTLSRLTDAAHVAVSAGSSITLRDVAGGTVVVRGGAGHVHVERVELSGVLDLQAGAGGITAVDVTAAYCRLYDYGGDISLDGCAGVPLEIAASGQVEVTDAADVILNASGDGGVRFSGSLDLQGSSRVTSHGGSVTLILPVDAMFSLEASAFNGSIRSDFQLPPLLYDDTAVSAQVNGGGPLLMIYSFEGDIVLQSISRDSE